MSGRGSHKQREDLSVQEIAQRLVPHAESLCKQLIPNGRKEGSRYRCASGFMHSGTQVSIPLTGAMAGRWKDFAEDKSGSLIDLIHAVNGGSLGDAVKWAKDYLGIDASGASRKSSAKAPPPVSESRAGRQQDYEKKRRQAHKLWRDSYAAPGTLVEAYLRGRGITVPVPKVLRFNPMFKRWLPEFEVLPAMLAAVQAADDTFLTVHATWLRPEGVEGMTRSHILDLGPDTPTPAATFGEGPKKLVRGAYTGGAIRLTPAGKTLALAEGIETALSVLQCRPEWAVWSAVSVSNMANVQIPSGVERLILLGDGDSSPKKDAAGNPVVDDDGKPIVPADLALEKAARVQAAAAQDAGRHLRVEIIKAPEGQDFNDLLRGDSDE